MAFSFIFTTWASFRIIPLVVIVVSIVWVGSPAPCIVVGGIWPSQFPPPCSGVGFDHFFGAPSVFFTGRYLLSVTADGATDLGADMAPT